jgi:hypothetical protein
MIYTTVLWVVVIGMPLPQYSSGPIDTAFPLVFMLMKLDETISLFVVVVAAFWTIVEKSCRLLISALAESFPPMPTQWLCVLRGNFGLGFMVQTD